MNDASGSGLNERKTGSCLFSREANRSRPVTRILCGGMLTRPKWTKLPKCIFYCLIRLFRKVAIHEKL